MRTEYHKIITVWERDPETKMRTIRENVWATPEFDYLRDNYWEATEKIDGTNIRVQWDGTVVEFGGKTDNAQIHANLVSRLREVFTVERIAAHWGDSPCVFYGEGFGNKIQKVGQNYLPDACDFILFDVMTVDVGTGGLIPLERHNVNAIAEKFGISHVPVIGVLRLTEAIDMVREGFQSYISRQPMLAEGLVLRPVVEMRDRRGNRIITKIKHKDFNKSFYPTPSPEAKDE